MGKKKKKHHKQGKPSYADQPKVVERTENVDKLMEMLKERVGATETPKHSDPDYIGEHTTAAHTTSAPTQSISSEQSVQSKTFLALIIGLIVGFGSAWLWLNQPNASVQVVESTFDDAHATETVMEKEMEMDIEKATTDDVMEEKEENVLGVSETQSQTTTNLVNVKDQQAGSNVFVSRIELASPGWVAIHEVRSGELSNVLGAKWFPAGIHQGDMKLLRATTPGKEYYAVLYDDANANKKFDYKVDPLVLGNTGTKIGMTFNTFTQ